MPLVGIRLRIEKAAMRRTFPVLILMWILLAVGGSPATAFDCSGVSLPSSMVICGDPDLIRLADERQQIYDQTRSRLTADQQNALWEDQKAWVRSYATACGVSPDSPAPIPPPLSVTLCFKRFAEARAAYLRTYGLPADPSSASVDQPAHAPADAKSNDVDEIALVQAGRLFEIPVQINGAITLNFIIDSGTSDVQIPFDVFSTLVRANTIENSDFIGEQTYVLADGSEKKAPKFLIRRLKIGNHMLHDVPGSVGPSTGSLLLGQSFLSNFDSWTLDNKRHVLKLVGKHEGTDEAARSTSSGQQAGPMASLSSPKLPETGRPPTRTAVVCGKAIDYTIEGGSGTGFLGVWAGSWNNRSRLCGALIVQGIDPSGAADVIYVYGGSGVAWKQQHRIAVLRDGVLSFQDDEGSTFKFALGGSTGIPGSIDAIFIGTSGRLTGTFQRSN